MIEKIIALRGVGLLHDPLLSGAIPLEKVTVIYGENGRGKSTFAGVCRCLAEGETSWLQAKKTICGKEETLIEFRIDKRNFKFSGGAWDATWPKMYVFDSTFIEKNLYSGSRVDPQHRESLLEFALGETGVNLKKEIDRISSEIERLNGDIKATTQAVEAQCKGIFTAKTFVALSPDLNLAHLIEETEAHLRDARNSQTIRNRPVLTTLTLPVVGSSAITAILYESLEDVEQNAERMVQEHIQQHLDTRGETWLREGMAYVKSKECPFCAQDASSSPVIRAYKAYFNEAYTGLKLRIAEETNRVASLLAERELDKIQNAMAGNRTAQTSWTDQGALVFPVPPDADTISQTWRTLRDSVLEILHRKADSPLTRMTLSESAQSAYSDYERLQNSLDTYNQAVKSTNIEIERLKDALSRADVTTIENDLKRLRAHEARFSPEVDALCLKWSGLTDRKKELEKQKTGNRKKLEEFTEDFLKKTYLERINAILGRFGAGFSVEELSMAHAAGTPRTEYGLRLLGTSVPLTPKDGSQPCPSFANTLSDGDRRSLALAFFLARLETELDLSNSTIVVDDPVSSLDIPRKRATLETIKEFAAKCSQIIILSHDAYFLRDVTLALNRSPLTQLQIRRYGDFSVLECCDIQKIVQDPYCANYTTLVSYLEKGPEGNTDSVAKAIREYLEGNLVHRFPIELGSARNLGEMIRDIRNSQEPSVFKSIKLRLGDLTTINDFTSPFHHTVGDRPTVLTDAELKPIVELALEIGRS